MIISGTSAPIRDFSLSLRTNFSWTLLGNLLYALSQWGFLILLAKVLDSVAVGQFAFALAVTAPIIIFANQGLTGLQATDAKGEFTFLDYFSCRLITTSLAFLFICVLSTFMGWPPVVIVVAAAKAVEALCDIKYGQYQRIDRMDRTAKSMILRGTVSLVVAGVLLSARRSIAWAAAGLLVANVVGLLVHDYRPQISRLRSGSRVFAWREVGRMFGRPRRNELFVQAFPLGVAAMLSSLTSSIPRYFIDHYSGAALLGIFSAVMYLLIAGRTLVTALAQSCVAQLSRFYIERNGPSFRRLLCRQMLVGLLLGAAGVLCSLVAGKFLLRVLYRPEYADYSNVLLLVMFAAALNYLAEFSNGGLLAVRAIKVQPVILALCAALILFLSFALVPRFGIVGGAWAVVITSAFQLAANLYCLVSVPFSQAVPAASVC